MHPIGAASLVDLLGPWAAGSEPLNEQLAAALARSIETAVLAPGTRLPSERELAATLGLSRTTIVLAYDRLRAAGLVRSRQGSGTRVVGRSGTETTPTGSGLFGPYSAPTGTGTGSRSTRVDPILVASEWQDLPASPDGSAPIELTVGALRGSPSLAGIAAVAVAEDLPELLADFGYRPLGLQSLRVSVARLMDALAVPTDPEQIVITTGAQQALDLLARALIGPRGSVVLEDPTYVGMVDALRVVGARMLPVPVDAEGILADIARMAVEAASPSAIYVVPTFHNPTGSVLPEERRRALAGLAADTGTLLIEDLTPDYGLGRDAPPPIAAFDRADRVVTVGSLSKAGWGGLRVGWMRLPLEHLRAIAAMKTVADHGSNVIGQAIARRLLDDPAALADRAIPAAAERRAALIEALRESLPDWEWTEPRGGLSLWVRLPGTDATVFTRLAAEHGVIVRPGPSFSPGGGFREHIRLAYGDDPERLREGVARLAAAWRDAGRARAVAGAVTRISV